MVLTRAARRQSSGEGGAQGDSSSSSTTMGTKHSRLDDTTSEDVQPKSKRQKTTHTTTTTTTKTRKARALKPVNPNDNKNKKTNAKAPPATTTTRLLLPKRNHPSLPTISSAAATVTATHQTLRTKAVTLDDEQPSAVASKKKTRKQPQRNTTIKKQTTRATASVNNDTTTQKQQQQQQPKKQPSTSSTTTNQRRTTTTTSSSTALTTIKHDVVHERYKDDPLMVPEYVHDMYQHYRQKEIITFHTLRSAKMFPLSKKPTNDHHRLQQPDITESMRSILVDWIVEVHYKFKLVPETLYLAVQIIDRFMATTEEIISRRILQCVGVTSLFIACKYEEMFVPEIRDLTYICDGAYTESQVSFFANGVYILCVFTIPFR